MNNQPPENDSKKTNDPKESIPLWLQGLSERQEKKDESASDEWLKEEEFLDEEVEPVEDWDEGLTDEEFTEEVHDAETGVEEDEYVEEDTDRDDLPDWLNELAEVSPETPDISGQRSEEGTDWIQEVDEFEDEDTEEVAIPSEQVDVNMEGMAEEPSFAQEEEYSDFAGDEAEEAEEEDFFADEEVPEWLREMIAIEERHIDIESQKLAQAKADEATRPVVIEDQPASPTEEVIDVEEEVESVGKEPVLDQEMVSEDQKETESHNEIPEIEPETGSLIPDEVEIYETPDKGGFQLIEDMIQEDIEIQEDVDQKSFSENSQPEEPTESEVQYEYAEDIEASLLGETQQDIEETEEVEQKVEDETPMVLEEESTLPVTLQEPTEPEDYQEDLTEFVETPGGSMPKFLVDAESKLEMGNVDDAIEIIRGYSKNPDLLEQTKKWLHTSIETMDCDKSKLWEALGDIAIQEGDFAEAFLSYTKAIKNLENIEEKNEIN